MSHVVRHYESQGESCGEGLDVAIKQLTLRGFDADLERRLHLEARNAGVSLNQAALRLLRRGAGLGDAARSNTVGSSLDHLIGTWSEADERELLEATAFFERVDDEFWR
jgi:hypothetical protein